MYFQYGSHEVSHLQARDKRLAWAMERIGPLRRDVVPDLFEALTHSIVGQQISTRAQVTIWGRLRDCVGVITPEAVAATDVARLQACGLSFRKVDYIKGAATAILEGRLDVEGLRALDDAALCAELVRLPGVGEWTTEMLMTFSLQRPNVMSFGDLAIHRGLRMLYRHKNVDRPRFERYRRRYAPYATVACLYLWAVAGGAIAELTDPATAPTRSAPSARPGKPAKTGSLVRH